MQIKSNFQDILPLINADKKYLESNEYKQNESDLQKCVRYISRRLKEANFNENEIRFNALIWVFANSSVLDVGHSEQFMQSLETFVATNVPNADKITSEFNIRGYYIDIFKNQASVNGIKFNPARVKEKAKDEIFLEKKSSSKK